MIPTLSVEGRIAAGLRELSCSGRSFVDIGKSLGAAVSQGRFSEALNGQRYLSHEVGDKLLEILSRMREVQSAVGNDIPIDWTRTSQIATALAFRLVDKTATELQIEDHPEIHGFAVQATQEVTA